MLSRKRASDDDFQLMGGEEMMELEDGEITLRREFKRDARVCTDKWMAFIYYLFLGSLLYLAKIGYSGGEI